ASQLRASPTRRSSDLLGSAWSCALHFAFELDEASGTETYLEVFRRGMARCHRQGDVCVVLAEPPLIPRGDDVPNPLQFLRTGCAHGDSLSCFDLGRMPADAARLMDPAGLESLGSDDDLPSHEATRGHLTVACDDDIGPACHLLALQLFRGEGGEANPREARARSRAACELGMREACDLLAQTGDGRTFPPPPGAEAYPVAATFEAAHRRYCGLGGHGACVRRAWGCWSAPASSAGKRPASSCSRWWGAPPPPVSPNGTRRHASSPEPCGAGGSRFPPASASPSKRIPSAPGTPSTSPVREDAKR